MISGPPCSGKTSVVQALAERGYTTVAEVASQVIVEGKLLPLQDRYSFQKEVFERQLKAESAFASRQDVVFFDRGIYDALVIYEFEGLPVPDFLQSMLASEKRYDLVLLFDCLDNWQDNGVRYENLEYARAIAPLYEKVYRRMGVPAIQVPAGNVEERVEFVIFETRKLMAVE